MDAAKEVLSWICLVSGASFAVVGGIGILRFPDFFSRMHAAGITDTLGASLVLAGLMLQAEATLVVIKLVMILFFLLVSSPTSAHALAKSARTSGLTPWTRETEDSSSPS